MQFRYNKNLIKSLLASILRFFRRNAFLFMFLSLFFSETTLAYDPRVFMWGFAGTEELGRLDLLLPLYTDNFSSLFYTDLQGEIDTKSNWFSGLGLGYRGTNVGRIWGGYLFLDRDYTARHHAYYILNPGFETLGQVWDFRVNAYLPIGDKKHSEEGVPPFSDTCGDNFNCDNSIFIGHSQFIQLLRSTEEVGTGIDAEVGTHFGRNYDFSLFGGAYYYHFDEAKDIKGLEARVVVPIRPTLALTLETSYDNEQGAAIMGGIRIQGGHLPHTPVILEDHLYDPVTRNLGTIKNGLSVPVARTEKLGSLHLIRDNIFFFTGTGGVAFDGPSTGTFENPLASDQFTQANVNGINLLAPNANLFFNAGTYVIEPTSPAAPNASISLPGGQSMFGRTQDYKCSAIGAERPVFLGEIQLLAGPNQLDSIVLTNIMTLATVGAGESINLTALNIQNAAGVSICNSEITASISVLGVNSGTLFVTGISTNNSQVIIETSIINAISTTGAGTGAATGISSVVGIGGNNVSSTNNNYAITDSIITALSLVAGDVDTSAAVGIGSISLPVGGPALFQNNRFAIRNTQILSQATAGGEAINAVLSAGIGSVGADFTTATPADFVGNSFAIDTTQISSQASVGSGAALSSGIGTNVDNSLINIRFIDNQFAILNSLIQSSATQTTGTIGGAFLLSAGIGSNASISGNASFVGNDFTIQNTSIESTGTNFTGVPTNVLVTGIGTNANLTSGALADFVGNNFTIETSNITAVGTTGPLSLNYVAAIGSNAQTGTANFDLNVFAIDASNLSSTATITGDNAGDNRAIGIGGNTNVAGPGNFLNTLVNVTDSDLQVLAQVFGDNSGINRAIGLEADAGSVINFISSQGLVQALVGGINTGENSATAFIQNGGVVNGGGSIQAQAIP